MPVSLHGEVAARTPSAVRLDATHRDDDLALLGELDGVADQVDDAPGAGGTMSPTSASGTSGAMS